MIEDVRAFERRRPRDRAEVDLEALQALRGLYDFHLGYVSRTRHRKGPELPSEPSVCLFPIGSSLFKRLILVYRSQALRGHL